MSNIPTVRPIADSLEIAQLQEAARRDDHYVLAPTHVIRKNGEIVGYWSIDGMPTVHLWHDSQALTARDSVVLNEALNQQIAGMGHNRFVCMCATHSPYYPHIAKLGFKEIFQSNLLIKEIPE